MPNIDIVNSWVIVLDSLLKDVVSVNGSEQVHLEALLTQAMLCYFFEKDQESLFKVLMNIEGILSKIYMASPEIILMYQLFWGLYHEDQKEALTVQAERCYLSAMICLF